MRARRILILYGTRHGQTARIAQFMAGQLRAFGDQVTLADGGALPSGLALAGFDGVILGASVIAGEHRRPIRHFARVHRAELNAIPSAFFSVSASAASEAGQADARRYVTDFLADAEWSPALAEPIAGSISYTHYDPFTRWMMRRICADHGGPTDTTRDHELTDWAQVQRFVGRFAALATPPEEASELVVPHTRESPVPRIHAASSG